MADFREELLDRLESALKDSYKITDIDELKNEEQIKFEKYRRDIHTNNDDKTDEEKAAIHDSFRPVHLRYKEQQKLLLQLKNEELQYTEEIAKKQLELSIENNVYIESANKSLAENKLKLAKEYYDFIQKEDNSQYNENLNSITAMYKEAADNNRELSDSELRTIALKEQENERIRKTSQEKDTALRNKAEKEYAGKRLESAKEFYDIQQDENAKALADTLDAIALIYETANKEGRELRKEEEKEIEKLEKKKRDLSGETAEKTKKSYESFFSVLTTFARNFITTVTDVFLMDRIENGLKDVSSAYESNFTTIAGYSGSDSREENHNFIKGVLNEVNSNEATKKGLNFSKDVFPEITEAVKNGFMGEEAEEVAISNAIDKKIMPWLETSSETWVQLEYNLSEDRIQSIKGQQLLLQETREGNRLLQSGVVTQLQESLMPSLDNIVANTTEVDDLNKDMQMKYMYLTNDMGYSKQEAMKYIQQETEAYQNPYAAITSGNLSMQMQAMDHLNGTNIHDSFMQSMIGSGWVGAGVAQEMGFIMGGETRTERGFLANATVDQGSQKYADAVGKNLTEEQMREIYGDATDSLAEKVTATQAYDNMIENWIAKTGFDMNKIAHGSDMALEGVKLLNDIKNWLIGYLATKIVDLFSNGFKNPFKTKTDGPGTVSKLLTGGHGLSNAMMSGEIASNAGKLGGGLKYGGLIGGLTQGGAGLSGGLASGAGAAGIGAAGLTAGAVMATKGVGTIVDTVKNWDKSSTADKGVGLGTGAAMAAGGGMLGAAALGLASGPVGWAGLAIGGIGMAVKGIYDYHQKFKKAGTDVDILSGSFKELKDKTKEETKAREEELSKIYENFYTMGDESEKRKMLVEQGIIPNTDKLKLSTEQMEQYINKVSDLNYEMSGKKEEILGALETEFSGQSKNEIKGVLDQVYGSMKGKSEEEQRAMLKALGFSDEEIKAGFENGINGAMGDDELWEFLMMNDTKMKGVNIGSLEEKIESGELSVGAVNAYMGKYTNSESRITSSERFMAGLDQLIDATLYLKEYQPYGREVDPQKAEGVNAAGFDKNTYDQHKQTILSMGKSNKWKVEKVFAEAGMPENALDDYPNSIKGFALGSTYIPHDMMAFLHAGERVLTTGQNKEYTEQLINNGSSNLVGYGIKDIVDAIKEQTTTFLNYLQGLSFNNESMGISELNMSPTMGNSKIVL